MSTQMIIRVDPELKAKIGKLAKSEGKSVSQVVREMLEGYVKDHDIEAYIDDLWYRIGDKLRAKGVDAADIPQTIKDVRAGKV
mgnify:CR=1 FL=1